MESPVNRELLNPSTDQCLMTVKYRLMNFLLKQPGSLLVMRIPRTSMIVR